LLSGPITLRADYSCGACFRCVIEAGSSAGAVPIAGICTAISLEDISSLNRSEGLRFGARVGVGAGRRHMIDCHSAALDSALLRTRIGQRHYDDYEGEGGNTYATNAVSGAYRTAIFPFARSGHLSVTGMIFSVFRFNSRRRYQYLRIGMRAELSPKAIRSAPLTDLDMLLGTITMSLALIAMSSCLPFIIFPASILISCLFRVTGSSRNMITRSEAVLNFIPCASKIACLRVAPSLYANEPGAFTSPPTKKTSACGILTTLLGSRSMFLSRSPLNSPLILTFISSYPSRSSA